MGIIKPFALCNLNANSLKNSTQTFDSQSRLAAMIKLLYVCHLAPLKWSSRLYIIIILFYVLLIIFTFYNCDWSSNSDKNIKDAKKCAFFKVSWTYIIILHAKCHATLVCKNLSSYGPDSSKLQTTFAVFIANICSVNAGITSEREKRDYTFFAIKLYVFHK